MQVEELTDGLGSLEEASVCCIHDVCLCLLSGTLSVHFSLRLHTYFMKHLSLHSPRLQAMSITVVRANSRHVKLVTHQNVGYHRLPEIDFLSALLSSR